MQYLFLIYASEAEAQKKSAEENGKICDAYMAFTNDLKKSGHLLGVGALEPVSTATTVRVKNGKVLRTDGPFAETREQLGGYYLIEAKDLDEAVAIAARMPDATSGSIEVRPILKFPGM